MPDNAQTIEQILTLLERTPQRITALTAGLSPALLHIAPGSGEWSANDVLAHLRACSDVWGDCMSVILAQERPKIRAVNPRTWIIQTDYPEQPFEPSLHAFAAQRVGLLAILKPLTLDAWARTATVTGAGKPLERTVLDYAQRLAVHERPHVKQIERIVRMNTLNH